jgi:hypothetical protein
MNLTDRIKATTPKPQPERRVPVWIQRKERQGLPPKDYTERSA